MAPSKNSPVLLSMLALAAAGASAFSACATPKKSEPTLDDQIAHTAPITGPQDLQRDTRKLIATAPGLTAEQRTRLSAIQATSGAKIQALREESLKLRDLLLKEVVRTDGYNDHEVDRIKSRLRTVEKERLDALFSALDQANTVLGHGADRRDLMDSMMRLDAYDSGFSVR